MSASPDTPHAAKGPGAIATSPRGSHLFREDEAYAL